MKYLNQWLTLFPGLQFGLSKEDKTVLDTIDPAKYIHHNLTKEIEVIQIIGRHKPQAWKWIRRYPALKDLPAEDYAILDHIVPNDYITDISEEDVRRIIAYRENKIKTEQDTNEILKAHKYYEEHKEEIEQEERQRSNITRTVKIGTILGLTFIATAITLTVLDRQSLFFWVLGILDIAIPWISGIVVLKRLDKNSVIPRNKTEDKKLRTGEIIFIISYFLGFIGISITLSTAFIWIIIDWDTSVTNLLTGLTILGISAASTLISTIFPTPKE